MTERPADGVLRTLGCGFIDVPAVRARVWMVWSERGLTRLGWHPAGTGRETALGSAAPEQSDPPDPYSSTLKAYFAGEAVEPASLPVELEGSAFARKVWEGLRRIPRGQVRSYAALAQSVGSPRAVRAVGGANGSNPIAIVVPCHRVIEARMHLGGYTGGLAYKRFLLELEGARIVGERVYPGQLVLDVGD